MNNVTTGYGKAQILKDVSLNVDENEIVALVGPNGAGKTTALRCIAGDIRPWYGHLTFKEHDLVQFETYQVVDLGIAYCPEGRDIFANLTVEENLKIGAYLIKDKAAIKSRLEYAYSLFPRLFERRRQLSGSLSGGEQQMLTIGRSLMINPMLLLLDEPSLGISPILVDKIFETIQQINDQGTSILLVEQNVSLALEVCKHAYVLEKGEIKLSGNSEKLRNSEYIRASYLGIK
jgi:branched-chain amino acid transport system ATP-binding protein